MYLILYLLFILIRLFVCKLILLVTYRCKHSPNAQALHQKLKRKGEDTYLCKHQTVVQNITFLDPFN